MSVELLHAAIEQKLQSNGAFVLGSYDKFQYDWWLNNEVYSFIKMRCRKKPYWNERIEESPVRYEGISSLVERSTINLDQVDGDRYIGQLPPDYLMLLDDRVSVIYDCKAPLTVTTQDTITEYFVVFKLPADTREDRVNDFYEGLTLFVFNADFTVDVKYDISDYPGLAGGVPNDEENYVVVQHLLNTLGGKDGNLYYEYYRGKYYPNSLIYVLRNPVKEPLSITVDMGDITESTPFEEVTYTTKTAVGTTAKVGSRLIRHVDISDIIGHPFGKTTHTSPIMILDRRSIGYYANANFLPTSVELTYIKRPLFTSYITGDYADLFEEYRSELIDLVVTRIMAANNTPNYQMTKAETIFND